MANRKNTRKQTPAADRRVDPGSLWLAGVGVVSLARKQGVALVNQLVGEGRRLQQKTTRFVRDARGDVKAQVIGVIEPVKTRVGKEFDKAGAAVQARVTAALSAAGLPTKADIAELSARVGTLSRQLKAAK
jgi:poly(hydroxyalkanoate) granule-associated protein